MALKINKSRVSSKSWGEVDKSRIWRRLKEGLQEGEEGVKEAIREMYAVVKAEINQDLTLANCWGPHHEIIGDEVVLNRAGVIASAQALAGARAEPNLTDEEWEKARRHIARHYRELEMELPDVLGGEMYMEASIEGEMSIEDIPLASWVNIEELKKGDDDPLQVIVSIPAGKSKRGWAYSPKALQRIVEAVNSQGLPGGLGHQKAEEVNHEFLIPATHWIGAKWDEEKKTAYFRGLIDKSFPDLKRWIKGNAIRTVSIFGIPTLKKNSLGEIEVVDYQPLSIDWTPLGRNGMDTKIVALGEMENFNEEGEKEKMSKEEILEKIKELKIPIGEIAEYMGDKRLSIVGELQEVLGVEGEDIVKEVRKMKEMVQEIEENKRKEILDKVVGEMVSVESLRGLIKRMVSKDVKDEESIRKAVGEILEMEEIKKIMGEIFVDKKVNPIIVNTENQLKTKKVKI